MRNSRSFLPVFIMLVFVSVGTIHAAVPNVVGTWTGSGKIISLQYGYFDATYTLTIQDQQNDLFRGTIRLVTAGADITMKLTGYIKADKTICANVKAPGSKKTTDTLFFGKYYAGAKPRLEGNIVSVGNADSGNLKLFKK